MRLYCISYEFCSHFQLIYQINELWAWFFHMPWCIKMLDKVITFCSHFQFIFQINELWAWFFPMSWCIKMLDKAITKIILGTVEEAGHWPVFYFCHWGQCSRRFKPGWRQVFLLSLSRGDNYSTSTKCRNKSIYHTQWLYNLADKQCILTIYSYTII